MSQMSLLYNNAPSPHKMTSLKVAYSVQPLAAKAKVALVAYGPWSAGLSNLPFFLRTTQSNKDQMAMMVS